MRRILSLVLVTLMFSCGNNNDHENIATKELSQSEMETLISEKESVLKKIDISTPETKIEAENLVKAYIDYADKFPKDSRCPEYLYKAAEVTGALNRYLHAIDIYERIINEYPESDKAPFALFLQAFNFENQSHDLKKAEELYKKFIEKYPNHEFVKDAKASIDNLGKTPEELIEEFEAKNKNV